MSYGTSEGASTSMSSALTWEEAKTQLTATGIPYPGIEVKIVDTDGSGRSESLHIHAHSRACSFAEADLNMPTFFLSANNQS
jgi:acyl-CoA synthetase (AMP-forming)/AMP-acid ligase II